jgi:hypothetical protein
MGSVQITNRAAVEAYSAAAWEADEVAGAFTPDGLSEVEVDRLLEQVDRELTEADRAGAFRAARADVDGRRVRRARRRGENAALRLLDANWLIGGLSSQGKTAGVRAVLADAAEEGAA